MKHITYLTSIVQRLTLEVGYYRQSPPSGGTPHLAPFATEELQRRFDPIVAEGQLHRLDSLLAQQSLLREADAQRISSLEADCEAAHQHLKETTLRLDNTEAALREAQQWHVIATEREVQLREYEDEVDRLRRTEQQLVANIRRLKQHVGLPIDETVVVPTRSTATQTNVGGGCAVGIYGEGAGGGCSVGIHGEGTPPTEGQRYARLFMEMDESAARQDLLVEELCFGPLQYALHMAVAYDTELQQFRDDVPTVADRPGNLSTSSQQEVLSTVVEVETLRQRCMFLDIQHSRDERLLAGERQRNEMLAADHCRQLERIQERLTSERREYLERLAVEVRHAFREGRLREKANRRARRASAATLETSRVALSENSVATPNSDGSIEGTI